jgi:DNA-binding Xre family transcriptional regulator
MLYFNVRRLLDLRGIENPYTFLMKQGFVSQTASNLVRNRVGHIKPEQMETLCLILNCTPNDLFDWRPDKKSVVPENHALRSLSKENTPSFTQMVKEVPIEKLNRLESFMNELKNED